MKPTRVAVIGATGRMGRVLLPLLDTDENCELVAAVTLANDPLCGHDINAVIGGDARGIVLSSEPSAPPDVVIEFTLAPGCAAWAAWCAEHGAALVSGTTGLDASQQAQLEAAARQVPVVWAPNMSVGVNLLLALAEEIAGKLGIEWDVEICETHHRRKVDAPSGTAAALNEAVCRGRGQRSGDVTIYGRQGASGPRPAGQVGMHSLRMGAVVGEHKVHFASETETLTLGHNAVSRETFAAGAVRAAKWVSGREPGLYSMRDVLGI